MVGLRRRLALSWSVSPLSISLSPCPLPRAAVPTLSRSLSLFGFLSLSFSLSLSLSLSLFLSFSIYLSIPLSLGIFTGCCPKRQVDDVVLSVDGRRVEGLSLEEVTSLFLGAAWSPVYLVIDRNGAVLSAEVIRDKVRFPAEVEASAPEITSRDHVQITSYNGHPVNGARSPGWAERNGQPESNGQPLHASNGRPLYENNGRDENNKRDGDANEHLDLPVHWEVPPPFFFFVTLKPTVE